MKILSVVGARPQFIKAALMSAEFEKRGLPEILVHTGQHYDYQMSQVFFDQMSLPAPKFYLGVGSGTHAFQTAEIMERLEPVVAAERPTWVLIYGDTNTTLAAALVASKLKIPLAHIEAGLRSFNKAMPEEINRIVADHIADALFVPNKRAADQLRSEGITKGVHIVGDLMVDSVMQLVERTDPSEVLSRFRVRAKEYALATVHRASNTDDPTAFARIVEGLRRISLPVIFPIHPRSLQLAKGQSLGQNGDNVIVSEPLPYADMIALERHARVILTDSGGVQKEALVLRVPCVTLRDETEWPETLEDGWNALAGTNVNSIEMLAQRDYPNTEPGDYYGNGSAAANIASVLSSSGHERELDYSNSRKMEDRQVTRRELSSIVRRP